MSVTICCLLNWYCHSKDHCLGASHVVLVGKFYRPYIRACIHVDVQCIHKHMCKHVIHTYSWTAPPPTHTHFAPENPAYFQEMWSFFTFIFSLHVICQSSYYPEFSILSASSHPLNLHMNIEDIYVPCPMRGTGWPPMEQRFLSQAQACQDIGQEIATLMVDNLPHMQNIGVIFLSPTY